MICNYHYFRTIDALPQNLQSPIQVDLAAADVVVAFVGNYYCLERSMDVATDATAYCHFHPLPLLDPPAAAVVRLDCDCCYYYSRFPCQHCCSPLHTQIIIFIIALIIVFVIVGVVGVCIAKEDTLRCHGSIGNVNINITSSLTSFLIIWFVYYRPSSLI